MLTLPTPHVAKYGAMHTISVYRCFCLGKHIGNLNVKIYTYPRPSSSTGRHFPPNHRKGYSNWGICTLEIQQNFLRGCRALDRKSISDLDFLVFFPEINLSRNVHLQQMGSPSPSSLTQSHSHTLQKKGMLSPSLILPQDNLKYWC